MDYNVCVLCEKDYAYYYCYKCTQILARTNILTARVIILSFHACIRHNYAARCPFLRTQDTKGFGEVHWQRILRHPSQFAVAG